MTAVFHYLVNGNDIDYGNGDAAFVAWVPGDYGLDHLFDVLQGPPKPEPASPSAYEIPF